MYAAQQSCILLSHDRFIVKIAEHYEEFEKALRLRFTVFNKEMGCGLDASYATGLDYDPYDDFCDHLIVVDSRTDEVVGTYRLMLGFVAEHNRGFYSASEFDISSIMKLPGEKLELGRSCVHRDYRQASVISLLWAGIARYVELYKVQYLFGCASLHTSDPREVSMIYSYLHVFHRADAAYTVHPYQALRGVQLTAVPDLREICKKLPPLVKGYLRLGARLCGTPARDPHFGTTDLFVLLETERLVQRYRRRYFPEAAGGLCPVS